MISIVFRYYLCYEGTHRVREGGNNQNGPHTPAAAVACRTIRYYRSFEGARRVWVGSDNQNGLASFGPLVRVFLYILCLTYTNYVYLGTIEVLKTREGLRWAATTKMGPNDARRVIFYYIIFFIYWLTIFIIFRLYLRWESTRRVRVGCGNKKRAQTTPDTSFGL